MDASHSRRRSGARPPGAHHCIPPNDFPAAIAMRFGWLAALLALVPGVRVSQPAPVYDVYAIRYATIAGFPVRGLVAGADTSRRMDLAMTVWLLRGNGRTVLVDAGFYRDKFVQRWKPIDFIQ